MTISPETQVPGLVKYLIVVLITLVSVVAVLQVSALTARDRGGLQVQDYYNYSIVMEAYGEGRMDSPWSVEGLKESYHAKFDISPKRPMLMALGPVGLVLIDAPRWILGTPSVATYQLWSAISITVFLVSLLYFLRIQEHASLAVWGLLFVTGVSVATRVSLTLGQTTLLGFASLLLAISEHKPGRHERLTARPDLLQTFALLLSSMKPAYFLPVAAILIADKRVRPFIIAGLCFLIISIFHSDGALGSYLASYLSALRTYVANSPNTLEGAPISSYTLPAILTLCSVPLYTANKIATISAACVAALAIVISFVFGRARLVQALILTSLSSLVLTPYIGAYDLQLVIAPVLLLWLARAPTRIEFAGLALLFAVCGNAIYFDLPGWAVLTNNLLILSLITFIARDLSPTSKPQTDYGPTKQR